MSNRTAIQQAIEACADPTGRITAEAVVEAASRPDSVLRSLFEWDDSKAAYEHRLEQARGLIRSVRVHITVEDRPISSIAYVRDPDERKGYISIESPGRAWRGRHGLVGFGK